MRTLEPSPAPATIAIDAPPRAASRDAAPPVEAFPLHPVGWYLFGLASELRHGPAAKEALGRRLVAYRTQRGRVAVLDARCSHLGSDLGLGRVVGEGIECPFHNWVYGPDGRCTHIPALGDSADAACRIPTLACQTSYPAAERAGLVFFFNGRRALFPLPFFPETESEDLVAAPPFDSVLDCAWYMIGSNGFDAQHFRAAHDRRLASESVVTCPAPFARRAAATFSVEGDTLRDRLTKHVAGDRVTLTITDWCGVLMFVTAKFRRTTSYGMVSTMPLDAHRTRVRVTVFVRRSRTAAGRAAFDPANARVRRYFIREFLRSDAERLNGVRYNPAAMIEADREMAEYFRWVAGVSRGIPNPAAGAVPPPAD